MKKTIIIIDDDADIRHGLCGWLSHDYHVKAFENAEDFLLDSTAMEECDCLLLDLRMPGMSGADLQNKLLEKNFLAPIIFMSGDAQKSDVISAWRNGAFDFILKPFAPHEISEALNKAFAAMKFNNSDTKPVSLPITKREAQVLLLLGRGLPQQEIADQLGLSLRTVKMYRAFLKNKLDLNTLADIGKFCDRFQELIEKHAQ